MEELAVSSFKTTGSKWLLPVSDFVGFPLDQVNFLACQVFALCAAFCFRLYLGPRDTSPLLRHAVAILFGLSFITFCFGWYAVHITLLVMVCYWILVIADTRNIHRYTMTVAISYLTACQVSRVFIYSYGILSTDFSGPLMIITQKTTMLAFQVHDGMSKKSEDLTADQKRLSVTSKPSLIEYLSYNLNFLSVLVGPCSHYNDYIDFIEGRHVQRRLGKPPGTNAGRSGPDEVPEPSPMAAVTRKLVICVVCMVLFLTLTKAFPITYNVDSRFVSEAPFLTRLSYAFFSIQAARPKFYFAWTLADAINNAAGYGVKGADETGRVSWDLISNLNIWGIETATSFKKFIDNWNIQTGVWLKTVCYDRAPRYRTALTFVLSALWHGVYPGYYFTFITAIPITMAARGVRRNLRPHFLSSHLMKLGYDVLTWAATQLCVCYTVMPFLLLAVEPTIDYYRSMYFHVHIISILTAIALSRGRQHGDGASCSSSNGTRPPSLQEHPPPSNNNLKGN
ncbi:lysophospholipid acyltransferase 1 isoform X1 [Esox lucius]|uniref:Membrane bound O-acyltransferase domain containing 1 n=2 Tax=Esox lucius TaxID=8010 RepID=A0A3P8ZD91_ESOLU|nr:lysophospholipid acyltransferase 1 isoform X1 [Esox lucius]XP_010864713.2 lysophospholipid acyltransferase 1 isoform X1 [Esox lucius]XP_010864714.2 lysophospholipid acyltransferase 1 isoform X1 [Esox lucius]